MIYKFEKGDEELLDYLDIYNRIIKRKSISILLNELIEWGIKTHFWLKNDDQLNAYKKEIDEFNELQIWMVNEGLRKKPKTLSLN